MKLLAIFMRRSRTSLTSFFRDLLAAKQMALLETFSMNYPGSPEQLTAVREALRDDIKLIEQAMKMKSIELVSDQVHNEDV